MKTAFDGGALSVVRHLFESERSIMLSETVPVVKSACHWRPTEREVLAQSPGEDPRQQF